MGNYCIETTDLNYSFGNKTILRNLNLKAPYGSIYGFLGPNGAGKTTTIRLLMGLLQTANGQISILGNDIKKNPIEVFRRSGTLIEMPSLYGHLSGYENMEYCRRLTGTPKSHVDSVLKTVDMLKHAHIKTRKYSLGMKQRLGLALALIQNPDLLILDEPTNGLDPNGIIEIRNLITMLNRERGITIFLSSHMLSEISQIATHAGVIHQGILKFQGSLQEMEQLSIPHLRIETNNPQHAVELLRLKSIKAEVVDSKYVETKTVDHQTIADLNIYLVSNGLSIYGLSINKPNIENTFLNLIK